MGDHYYPIIVAALTVLILGCWNPVALQAVQNGKPSGHPSYMWLSFMSLIAGLLTCYLMHPGGGRRRSPGSMIGLEYL